MVHPMLLRHAPSCARTNPRCGVCPNSEKSNFNMFFLILLCFQFGIMCAKNSIYSWILLDKNISFLTSWYKKWNHFFKILFELAPVSPTPHPRLDDNWMTAICWSRHVRSMVNVHRSGVRRNANIMVQWSTTTQWLPSTHSP